jgi:hypothetical protein
VPASHSFDYALLRLAPHVEREEFINVGVILFCRTLRFLGCRVHLDVGRLVALAPGFDSATARTQLDLTPVICAGGPAAGPIGELDQAERFRWLTSPRSTVLQVSPVHCGLCADPQAALDGLFDRLVLPPPAPGTSAWT